MNTYKPNQAEIERGSDTNQSNVEWLLNLTKNPDPAHAALGLFVAQGLITNIAELFDTSVQKII